MTERLSFSEVIFARLVALFPREFADRFGSDMRELFRDQLAEARERGGRMAVLRFWLRALPSMTRALVLEHIDALRERRARARSLTTHSHLTIGGDVLPTILSDLRYAIRMLRKAPVFTAIAVLVISLGTGAVTTIYSAMNAIVLRQLPAATDGARLVALRRTEANGRDGISTSQAFHSYLQERSRTLQDVAVWSRVQLSLAGSPGARDAHALNANITSGNYFSVLGVRPALGRFFIPEEDSTPLSSPVIVVSHSFWTTRLRGDSGAIGAAVKVNGHPYTLIGVAPTEFRGVFTPLEVDAWVPLAMHEQVRPTRGATRNTPWLWTFGRLADGVSREDAARELAVLTSAYAAESGESPGLRENKYLQVTPLTGLPEDAKSGFLRFMALLLGAAALVLAIASINVGSMLSARAVGRRREMALRTALGAARSRLVRQLLTESLLLFVLGAIGGVAVAWLATSAFERVHIPGDAGVSLELSPDPSVLGVALLVALATGIAFGLGPALQGAERNITVRLRNESNGSARRSLFGNMLVMGQLALSLVLLVGAGLFMRALAVGASVDPGFDRTGVLVAQFNSESWGYDTTKSKRFYETLLLRVGALPGVTAAAYSERVPLTLSTSRDEFEIAAAGGDPLSVQVSFAKVTPRYFDVVKMPILRGRGIVDADRATAPAVAVINERMANTYWPDGSAIGRTIGHRGKKITVVGIVRDAKYVALDEGALPFMYGPLDQHWQHRQVLMVRSAGDAPQLARAIQSAVREMDPAVPAPAVSTLLDETSIALFPQRVAALVTGVLGGVGLLLATVGLYGIIAFATSRRTKEIGIRMAVGARGADVLAMVVGDGMRLAIGGVAIGLLLAAGVTRVLTRFLFGVNPMDALTFAGMSALFVAVALLASYLPARRAATVDPMSVLRSD